MIYEELAERFDGIDAHPEAALLRHLSHPVEVLARRAQYDWLIKNWIPRFKHVTWFGETGSMKTFTVLDLALAVAGGSDRWCCNLVKNHGVTLFVGGEDPDGVALRVQAYDKVHGTVANSLFYLFDQPLPVTSPRHVAAFCDAIETKLGNAVELVIIDTADTCFGDLDDSQNKDMRVYNAGVQMMITRLECSVISVMHPGHTNTQRERGASNLKAAADVRYEVKSQGDDEAVITNVKMKNGAKGSQVVLKRQIVEMGVDEDGDLLTSCVMAYRPDGEVKTQEKPLAGQAASLQFDLLQVMQSHGKQALDVFDAETISAEGIKGRVLPIQTWRDFAYDHSLTGKEPNTKKQAFNRARDQLKVKRKIGEYADYVFRL